MLDPQQPRAPVLHQALPHKAGFYALEQFGWAWDFHDSSDGHMQWPLS
jgi:hypothetical protein